MKGNAAIREIETSKISDIEKPSISNFNTFLHIFDPFVQFYYILSTPDSSKSKY